MLCWTDWGMGPSGLRGLRPRPGFEFPWAGERLERLILYFISAVGKPKLPLVYHQGFGAVVPAAPP